MLRKPGQPAQMDAGRRRINVGQNQFKIFRIAARHSRRAGRRDLQSYFIGAAGKLFADCAIGVGRRRNRH